MTELDLDRVAAYEPREVPAERAEQAAVLVPIVERDGGQHVLFTERSQDLSTHAGQMSFPGGGRESDDPDLEATALREAHEEVAIDPETVAVVGRLDDVPGPYGHVVRPFVGRIPDREYAPASGEVAAVVVLPVATLSDPANYSTEERSDPERGTGELPFFRVDDHVVWGLTGVIFRRLLQVAGDWSAPENSP